MTDRLELARRALQLETQLNQAIDAADLAKQRGDKELAKKFKEEANRLDSQWQQLRRQLKRGY